MIDKDATPSVRRQCELLAISRNRVYRRPGELAASDLALMEKMDRLHLEDPTAGSRRLVEYLRRDGYGPAGRRRVRRLMRQACIEAIYPKPRTTLRGGTAGPHPYLLRGLAIDRPNQVWCADITYIPMRRGFMYLFAIMDWYSRRVVAWEISNTLETEFCLRALRRAMEEAGGAPEIMNTDQGCQFTSDEWTGLLKRRGISISMDGKGAWRDNRMIERLWRSVKYEDVYLRSYEDGRALSAGLSQWICHYNYRRPHQHLGGATPEEIYRATGGQVSEQQAA
jgi:putative transposase